MKGRSHRSAPLEDWGDGQWTVDCSCGVNFDDGEEMVSCDECGVWVHTRCSHFVRGEASFACHNCKGAAKRPLSVDVSRDAEETEVAKLLVELPTKTDRCPPAIPSAGAPYRPPFRLWAHVPKEERVHVHGVPGGDPALFHGLSSTIFSANLWKCTGYVPKKFNFKYKEFPCWEEEERDNVSLGADVLFSLSKEAPHSAPMVNFEKILSPGESKKDGDKTFLVTHAFGCVKKERNKLRVPATHLNKGRKEESCDEEKEVNGKKRSMGDSNEPVANIKDKADPAPVYESREADLCENGDNHQIAQSDALGIKSVYRRKDALKLSCKNRDEGMENGNKPKHMLVFKASRRCLSEEACKSKVSAEPVKVEKADQLDDRVSCKLNTVVPFSGNGNSTGKIFTKIEDSAIAVRGIKEPEDENLVDGDHNGGSTAVVALDSEKMPSGICCDGNEPDVPDILPSAALGSFNSEKIEVTMTTEGGDQVLENSNSLSCPAFEEKPRGSTDLQSEDQKSQVVQKDSEVNQNYQQCTNTEESEPIAHDHVVSTELKDVSRVCYAVKSSGAKVPTFQKAVPTVKELSASKSPVTSKLSISSSLTGKAIHTVKHQRMKVTASGTGKKDIAVISTSTKEKEQENSQEQPNASSSQDLAETPVATSATSEATTIAHATANESKPTPVSSHKNDKAVHPSGQSGSKLPGHSVASQAALSTTTTSMLSDEELALLLHQELNSSPRVPRVSRIRQATTMQFSIPSATSILSKRSSSGGRDQVSVFKRKHKEDSVKDGSHKSRDAIVESRRAGQQRSPEPKQHESALLNDGFTKKGKRSRSPDTIAPSKTEASNSSPVNLVRSGSAAVRSLPGLIDDIMSKGKCSTYEELCDAVRPFWHSLRKPNGERYAYSSHSQAVLDCLRNRSEWAHLIDRGPKTNASKRRRKVDPESPTAESEHEDAKNKFPGEMGGNSCRDDFPKGKRNLRKPRLLEARGRAAKEATNRCCQGGGGFLDDACPAFSPSSNEETESHANDEAGMETDASSDDDSA